MITLTVHDKKKDVTREECYTSHDKAKARLVVIKASKGNLVLTGASYEEDDEKSLLRRYLPIMPDEKHG